MKKPNRETRRRARMRCFDHLYDRWDTLRTLAGLLRLCQGTSEVEAYLVGNAADLMERELKELHAGLRRLQKELAAR